MATTLQTHLQRLSEAADAMYESSIQQREACELLQGYVPLAHEGEYAQVCALLEEYSRLLSVAWAIRYTLGEMVKEQKGTGN